MAGRGGPTILTKRRDSCWMGRGGKWEGWGGRYRKTEKKGIEGVVELNNVRKGIRKGRWVFARRKKTGGGSPTEEKTKKR